MRRNNAWKPPDYRSAVRDGRQPDDQEASSVTRRVSQGQVEENGAESATKELVNQLVKEDSRERQHCDFYFQ